MLDPQVAVLAALAWSLGVILGGVGAFRHALACPAPRPPGPTPPPLDPTPDYAGQPWPRFRGTMLAPPPGAPAPGPVRARGICLVCGQHWGTCEHTRNG